MAVLVSINNNATLEKYIIPKNTGIGNTDFVEITIDYASDLFVARKIKGELKITDEWQEYNDFAFPSSLLNRFLRYCDIAT